MTLALRAAGTRPRCLNNLKAVPDTLRSHRSARFALSSRDGIERGALYGFGLGRLNPTYKGPPLFVSPLAIQWQGQASRTPLLDTHIHGYHGEGSESVAVRGSGTPEQWHCVHCGQAPFSFHATFTYAPAVDDLWQDEPELPIQDYFTSVTIDLRCEACGTDQVAAEIET